MGMTHPQGLSIGDDPAFQRREWVIQQVGFWCLAGVVVAGTLGVLGGSGPLNAARSATDGLLLEFQRTVRWHTPAELRIELGTSNGTDEVWLEVGEEFASRVRIDAMFPQPVASHPLPKGYRYVFAAGQGSRPVIVDVRYTPDRPGPLPIRLRTRTSALSADQFVLP